MKPKDHAYHQALDKAQEKVRSLDPAGVACRSGTRYESDGRDGSLCLSFFGKQYQVRRDDGAVREVGSGEEPDVTT